MNKTEYIRPSKCAPLQSRECFFNARAYLRNELGITYVSPSHIEEVERSEKRIVYRIVNSMVEIKVAVYRNVSKVIEVY